ncbi:TIGR03086 family protein [Rhodococcus triatomae]|uniref:TIGR03086 family protein n=1 Tax=Rhodococcus triatomae TaxID=300028 RepID=A0A1G8GIP0_9NOCA|nr:TIGR03086 family metal-binding protein [Rhodococcus triatomae]QNG20367.1 TIGR03086 family protein [Rhodococcus triatomae]QNG23717.1 TIGR03086 family protein [Rhodococcus triatomae]SDH94232.1 TIGR03086 family protein [Rhodococcus triatomae]
MDFDWISLQRTARDEFGARVAMIVQWSGPTPDTDWTVTDLVRHVVVEQQWVPPLLAGKTVDQARSDVASLHGDLRAEWNRYAHAASLAWEETDLQAPVHLSFGTFPVEYYLRQQTSDIAVHAWDLARAVGADERLDPTLVEAVWRELDGQRDMLADSGLFGDPVPVEDDAPLQDRLLALTGRNPR